MTARSDEYEQLIPLCEPSVGLRGFICIHNTIRGPAFGGTRIFPYQSDKEAALDATRLARAMTFKAAVAELPCGGGKGVLFPMPPQHREKALERYGQILESLAGTFFTGPDMGLEASDLEIISRRTRFVAYEAGPELGDLNEMTAIGVWHAIRACMQFAGLDRGCVAIQGVGHVGHSLARILHREGWDLVVSDIDVDRQKLATLEFGARVVSAKEILSIPCDVFAPCAQGGVLTPENVSLLRARMVCGCANNVLSSPRVANLLCDRGVWYVPDYVANAGGVIRGVEWYLSRILDSRPSIEKIYQRTLHVLESAALQGISTVEVADRLAQCLLSRERAN